MSLPAHWVLATGNRGKLAELKALLAAAGLDVRVSSQSDFRIESPPETATTFVENALVKARHAARISGLPAIADDSGLVVPALGGVPGVRSARYAGEHADDRANVVKLLSALEARALDRAAKFHCVLVALEHCDDPAPLIASGTWAGQIARAPKGENGFGYDPVFFDPAQGCTAAELDAAAKNRVSHRGTALRRLVELLKNR